MVLTNFYPGDSYRFDVELGLLWLDELILDFDDRGLHSFTAHIWGTGLLCVLQMARLAHSLNIVYLYLV